MSGFQHSPLGGTRFETTPEELTPAPPARSAAPRRAAEGQTISLKTRALRLLARRDHTFQELRRKLQPWEDPPGTLEPLLEDLQAKGFVSATRVVESFIHQKASRLGVARLRQELLSKGVDPADMHAPLAELQSTEMERALAAWKKKFAPLTHDASTDDQAPLANQRAKEQARQMRFLLGRGFSMEVARRVVFSLSTS